MANKPTTMKIKKGDLVQVISGRSQKNGGDRGKQGKVIRRTSKVKAHDEQNEAGVGDRVLIMETRPLSATKHWRIVEILEKAK